MVIIIDDLRAEETIRDGEDEEDVIVLFIREGFSAYI